MFRSILSFACLIGALLACAVPANAAQQRCMEDQPCWTWSKMGNHKRGVTTAGGKLLVVGPCRFATLYVKGALADTPRMRGDWWAIHHGCSR